MTMRMGWLVLAGALAACFEAPVGNVNPFDTAFEPSSLVVRPEGGKLSVRWDEALLGRLSALSSARWTLTRTVDGPGCTGLRGAVCKVASASIALADGSYAFSGAWPRGNKHVVVELKATVDGADRLLARGETASADWDGDGQGDTDCDDASGDLGACDAHATCDETATTARCSCGEGWTGDGKSCTDVDECTLSPCGPGTCANTAGGYACDCNDGYTGSNGTCVDVDECAKTNGGCDANATCRNTVGGRTCECKVGWSGDGVTCADVDECAPRPCGVGNSCVNKASSYECRCGTGYRFDGTTCVDVDECATANGGCDANATCLNLPGSRGCSCNAGFSGNGTACADVNECTTANGGCDANALCTNTTGSFACSCRTGWTGNGRTCTDVDECRLNRGGCHADAACINTPGARSCVCNDGYAGDGFTCTDVDECAVDNGGCDVNATCGNAKGGRTCTCKPGYSGDGVTCVDVNECAQSPCGTGSCTNTVGAYSCSCIAPQVFDGTTCDGSGALVTKVLAGTTFEFSRILGGSFTMGAPATDGEAGSDERPQRSVTISKSFLLLRTETTQAQYQAVIGSNPSYFTGDSSRPVEQVSWTSSVAFCDKLSQLESVPQGTYRLPTEAEWEYAARAGSPDSRYGAIDSIAWYASNSGSATKPVRGKAPNAWNLYDMLGNVWEWNQDWYGGYAAVSATDPTGPASGSHRVFRGGGWDYSASYVRASKRTGYTPGDTGGGLGFRPLRSLP